jgi:hypothetical protein
MIACTVYLLVFILFVIDVNQHIDAICESLFYEEKSHATEQTSLTTSYDHYTDYNNLY